MRDFTRDYVMEQHNATPYVTVWRVSGFAPVEDTMLFMASLESVVGYEYKDEQYVIVQDLSVRDNY